MTQSTSQNLHVTNMTNDELELLKRLEEENRRIEYDLKSPANAPQNNIVNTRSPELHHKQIRQDSISSDASNLTVDNDGNLENEWNTWNRIINNWTIYMKKKPQWIKDTIRAGVPVHFRPLLWQCLAKVDSSNAKQKYADYMKMTSPCEKVIRRDISRTYPEHELFKEKHGIGQERLFNVIKAYSLYDREVGYCQGIGFIVGLLLMHMPEEEAFAVLVSILHDFGMRDMYKPDMFYLGLCIYQFECMVQEFLPDLNRHFQQESFNTSMYASSWFLTLFTNQFPFTVACRTMDMFLSEGIEIIFRMGIALLDIHQDELMLLSMEDMLKYFQKDVPIKHENDHESLFQRAFSVQYNGKKMKKLEKEYTVIRKEEQEEQIEIRRLRNENRLLKQRVDNLEKESATLANRLIEGQVSNAQYAEESYQLKRENCTLKKQVDEKISQNSNKIIPQNNIQNSSDSTVTSNDEELEALRGTIDKLTIDNRNLQSTPHIEIASLQEELTLVKMRDAEAQVNMNELRQRIADLNREWQLHDSTCKTIRETNHINDPNPNNDAYDLIAHELLSLKMREAQTDCDNKLLQQQVMDIDTQRQVLYNQIKRQDDEIQRIRVEFEESRVRENELRSQLHEMKHQMYDGELRQKEDSMMLRIREAESTQTIGDLRQRIAELEIQNQELITRDQIMDDKDLEDKLLELQDEVRRIRLTRSTSLPLKRASLLCSSISWAKSDTIDEDEHLVIRLRLLQTLHRKHSTATELNRTDYEESDDESLTSPLSSSSATNRLSSSSIILSPSSFISPNHRLRQSTPSLFPTISSSLPSTSSAS
ncbi:unnamed protein product [Adineta steineri]|uniref:Rab-GAP TBC domain-containing protein n=1 Tax=Adineta steineri TaxID=433720 RepID=A0A813V1A9_9BILA|nr:unnamed protein product [Adineta steineri]CAF0975089.1 unnamed protein product [Adineta steineri]